MLCYGIASRLIVEKRHRLVIGEIKGDFMATLKVNLEGRKGFVDRKDYVRAKTKALQEFGYPALTEKDVDTQIDALIEGKEFGKGLTVIGMFMEGEVEKDQS